MPRRAQPDLRDRLVSEAEAIVAAEGLDALTARNLAGRANCAVGSIYNAFRDLDDLIVAVHSRTLDKLGETLAAEHGRPDDTETKLLALAERYIGFIERHRHAWLALFEHHLPEGRSVPAWYQAKLNALFAIVEEIIAPLVPDDATERQRQARILWSALQGICSLGLTDKLDLVSQDNVHTMARTMIETYLAGLRQRQGGKTSVH
jgi:AcrR family transcriptional regulator